MRAPVVRQNPDSGIGARAVEEDEEEAAGAEEETAADEDVENEDEDDESCESGSSAAVGVVWLAAPVEDSVASLAAAVLLFAFRPSVINAASTMAAGVTTFAATMERRGGSTGRPLGPIDMGRDCGGCADDDDDALPDGDDADTSSTVIATESGVADDVEEEDAIDAVEAAAIAASDGDDKDAEEEEEEGEVDDEGTGEGVDASIDTDSF
jgi:hypothetical protein